VKNGDSIVHSDSCDVVCKDCPVSKSKNDIKVSYAFCDISDSQEKINRAFDVLFNEILNQEIVDNNVQLGVE